MNRFELLQQIAENICSIDKPHPVLVGIDGIDAAGKTTLADELVPHLNGLQRNVARASIDGFHNPRSIRTAQGPLSPKGYFEDSFDYSYLTMQFLDPIRKLTKPSCFKSAKFDFKTNQNVDNKTIDLDRNSILLFEGVFLFRKELNQFWDYRIFVDIDFETSLERGIKRDSSLLGDEEVAQEKYTKRYIPGQKIYFEKCQPQEKADVIIKNDDPSNPTLIFR
jgi:uridine kinase